MSDTLFRSKAPRNRPSTFAPPSKPYNIHRPSVAILARFLSTNELPMQSRIILAPASAFEEKEKRGYTVYTITIKYAILNSIAYIYKHSILVIRVKLNLTVQIIVNMYSKLRIEMRTTTRRFQRLHVSFPTWLNTTITNAEIYIEGYTLYRQDRLNKRGGGVCAYIRNDIKVSKLKEISSVSENYFHQLWLKLQSKKLKSIVICISYRPSECPLSCLETNLKPSFVQALLLNKPIFIGRSELQRYERLSREHTFHVRDELEPINHNTN
jgi:hypothetical protein